jgi:hypothetical protein
MDTIYGFTLILRLQEWENISLLLSTWLGKLFSIQKLPFLYIVLSVNAMKEKSALNVSRVDLSIASVRKTFGVYAFNMNLSQGRKSIFLFYLLIQTPN